jgi:hypothetical protein
MGQNWAKLISLLEDFHASRSVALESGAARETVAISGLKCFALFQRRNPDGSSAKTSLVSLILMGGWFSKVCSLHWKLKVTKYNRLLFQLALKELATGEIEYGLLPTPLASELIALWSSAQSLLTNNGYRKSGSKVRVNLSYLLAKWHLQNGGLKGNLIPDPCLLETMMGFPIGWTELGH